MKYLFTICLLTVAMMACKRKAANVDATASLEPLVYTLYTNKSELFVEFKPLVVGQTSKFAAHLTLLGENFLPYTEGTVTVSFILGEKGIKKDGRAHV